MAPERPVVSPGRAHTPRELPQNRQLDMGSWPLPARIVRQIQREVARSGRSLQRLEVRGAVIDNFDALGPPSPPSPRAPSPPSYAPQEMFFQSREVNIKQEYPRDGNVKLEYSSDVNIKDEYSSDVNVKQEVKLEQGEGQEDSDLTSLSWLQDRNLLRSITLTKSDNGELRPMSQQSIKSEPSPTSDYLEESVTSDQADSSGSDHPPSSPPLLISTPHRNTSNGYHQTNKTNGNSSKLKHPHNVPYNPLVHTQNKPPYSFSCLIFMAIEDSPVKALPVKEIYAWIVQHFPYFRSAPSGWKNSVRHNLSLNKCFQKVEKAPSLGKGSLWMVDDQYRSNLLQAFSRAPFHPCVPGPHNPPASAPTLTPNRQLSPSPPPLPLPSSPVTTNSNDRLASVTSSRGPKGAPNPQLFPFLSRRLAASEPPQPPSVDALSGHDSNDSLDEVVAAAMVLALKHGPGVLPSNITSSHAIQDHTYSAATASPEAGYASDEQRKTAEALLHLAGVAIQYQNQQVHRPRLLRTAPKRQVPQETESNNNRPGRVDHNLSRSKRPRHHTNRHQ